MPSKKRTASQARKDRAALKRLQKSGIFRGKIDLRKAPSKAQLKRIAELKAKSAKPPKTKTGNAKLRRKRVKRSDLERDIARDHKLTTYALPFLRRGQSEPEWRRFTREQLKKFLAEYKAGDEEGAAEWREFAVRETWSFATKTERGEFRHDVDLYFTGRRIDEPQGGTIKQRKTKGHSRTGTKRAGRRK